MQTILVNHLLEPGNKVSGITNYLFSLLAEMAALGQYRFVLLTSWDQAKLPSALQNNPAIDYLYQPYIESTPKNILNQLRILPAIVAQRQIDLEFNPNPLGGFLGRWPRISVVHDMYFDVAPQAYKWHHRLWWRMFFPLSCRRSQHIVCVSHNTRNDLQHYHPQFAPKTIVVHEGPCLEPMHSGMARTTEKFGLFVANLSPNKGSQTLVAAMSELAQTGQPVDVRHVGSDPQGFFPYYASQIAGGRCPSTLGYQSASQLSALYSSARYLAFPSHYEGFGLPIIEAQSHGLPVIASDIPVLREVAGEGALYFPLKDSHALAQQMQRLINDEALFAELSEKARANAARFSWKKAAQETCAIFAQVLA